MIAYRRDIDGLRALAVLGVIAYHALPNHVSGGFAGVDVFFVISGYLISGLIQDEIAAGQFSYLGFYARRIRRIFPALLAVLVCVLLAGWLLLLPGELRELGRETFAAAFFSANFLFLHDVGYFDLKAQLKPLLHLWSLGIEEQFYLAWPLIAAAIWKLTRHRIAMLAVLALASFAFAVFLAREHASAAFYLPFTRGWELLLGAIVAAGSRTHAKPLPLANLLPAVGLVLIFGAFVTGDVFAAYPVAFVAVAAFGTILILLGDPTAPVGRVVLSNPIAVYVGLISYPLYLWHWPLLVFARIETLHAVSTPLRGGLVLLAFGLAALTYHGIEKPLRARPANARLVLPLLAAVVLTGLLGLAAGHVGMGSSEVGADRLTFDPAITPRCAERYLTPNGNGFRFCAENTTAPRILILGNSLGHHLFRGFAGNRRLAGGAVLALGACDAVDGLAYPVPGEDAGVNCSVENTLAQRAFFATIAQRYPSLKYVVLSESWPRFLASGAQADYLSGLPMTTKYVSIEPADAHLSDRDLFARALARRVAALEAQGLVVVIVLPTPRLPYHIRACLDRPFIKAKQDCRVALATQTAASASITAIVGDIQRHDPKLRVYDPMPVFCTAGTCAMKQGDEIFLRDSLHLTPAGSARVAAGFATWARAALPQILRP